VTEPLSPYFIGIAGGTAGGKTTFARMFRDSAPAGMVGLVYLDSYYRAQDDIPFVERTAVNYDHPDAFEFELLHEHLCALRNGQAVEMPHYDFTQHTRGTAVEVFQPAPIILVEGILTLHDEAVRKFFDCTIFVDAPDAIRLERRIERDVLERNRTRTSVIDQWNNTVQPMHYEFCLPTKSLATHILSGTADGNKAFVASMLESLQAKLGSTSSELA
jgi:uridine kinase